MATTRNIALFSTSFLAYSQTFIYDEIKAHSENYNIEVFCKNRMNETRFPYSSFHCPKNKFSKFFYENAGFWPPFSKVFKNKKFDLIHAHFGTGAVYALHYAKKFNIPLVVTFHGNDVACLFGPGRKHPSQWRYNILIKKIIDQMSLGLVVSKELMELLKNIGCPEEKMQHFRLGIDTSAFKPTSKEKSDITNFLLIGRFTEKKGHIYALRAFKKVITQGHKATLTFIGGGDLLEECKQFVADNKLTDSVIFSGVLPSEEIADKLNSTHVLLVPSVVAANFDREGLPTVIKEAMAVEVPVIGTYHAGIPELITDNENGFLVPERDINSLAEKMTSLIQNPNLIKEFGSNGRKRIIADFDINKEVSLLEKYYEQVLSEVQ